MGTGKGSNFGEVIGWISFCSTQTKAFYGSLGKFSTPVQWLQTVPALYCVAHIPVFDSCSRSSSHPISCSLLFQSPKEKIPRTVLLLDKVLDQLQSKVPHHRVLCQCQLKPTLQAVGTLLFELLHSLGTKSVTSSRIKYICGMPVITLW